MMGIGPVPAIRKLLAKAAKTLDQVDYVEVNEACAAQVLAVAKELELNQDKSVAGRTCFYVPTCLPLPLTPPRLNMHGGAIALGHPLGMSGARILTHLTHCLAAHRGPSYALGAACIGGGQGIAVLLEKA